MGRAGGQFVRRLLSLKIICYIYLSFYLKRREIFHLLDHSPNACHSWAWASLEVAAGTTIRASLGGGRQLPPPREPELEVEPGLRHRRFGL